MFRKESGQIDMVSLILTVVIAAVTMMVGLVVVANMETSMPDISSSALSGSLDSVMSNTGTAFNFLAHSVCFEMVAMIPQNRIYNIVGSERGVNKPSFGFLRQNWIVRSRCRVHHRYCRWRARQLKLIFSTLWEKWVSCVGQGTVRRWGSTPHFTI